MKKLLGELELDRIYQRDCIEGMRMIPDKSIDMILCDLPYGITARNKWDVIIPFDLIWNEYERIIKDNGAIVLTAIQPFASALVMSNPKIFRYEWIWQKSYITGVLNAKKQPVRNHEQILVFYKKQPTYNPQGITKVNQMTKQGTSSTNYGKRNENNEYFQKNGNYPRSVQLISSKGEGKKLHPTQKPVALFEYLIRTYTNEGEIVLDNCIGSGTTAVAAVRTGRHFIGFEIEPEYVATANQRLEAVYDEIAERRLTNDNEV